MASCNVVAQSDNPGSMLSLYQALIGLRRSMPTLAVGYYRPVEASSDLLAYTREHQGQRVLVVLNFGREPASFDASGWPGQILLSTLMDRQDEPVTGKLALRASEGVIVKPLA